MDARDIVAHQIPGASAELCFGVADAIIERLHAAGIDLIHRDENHGPTLERAGVHAFHEAFGVTGASFARALELSIRAMGEKK